MKRHPFAFFLILVVAFFATQTIFAQAQKGYSNLQEALTAGGRLSGSSGPRNVIWIDKGERYSYISTNRETRAQEILAVNPDNGKEELIFSTANHKSPGSDNPFNYNSFQWTSDSRFIVFQNNFRPIYRRSGISDYYVYSVADKTLSLLVSDAMTAELSPDGKKVGYERGGNLFSFNLDSQKETQLTDSGEANFYNGRFGWVYEEEFGLAQAWSWSPDSKYIAYWQSDEREVELFISTDYSGTYPSYVEIPYPKVGAKNPDVKIGVVNVETTGNTWMDVDMNDGYIPRIYWTNTPGKLALVHLNRAQNHLKLSLHDVESGSGTLIMEEKNENGWIDVFDFFAGVNHYFYFPENLDEFFWISERDGWNHIYRYGYDGTLKNQVTKGEWEVTIIHAIDPKSKTIFYSSTEASPLERQLYSVSFDGKKKNRLTKEPGQHSISMSQNGKYYIDRYSNVSTPTQVELWTSKGKMLKKIEDNSAIKKYVAEHKYSPRELFTFTTTDGQELDGYLIKPFDFDPNKSYPVILNIYGGPGAQGVYNIWESNGWNQFLAQQGYVVVNVNNRGSGGYGHDFEKIVYKNLGHWEANDFAETATYLANTYNWVDGSRMGIRGHSYGGYMSSYSISKHPDVFKVAIVGAPVTDWRLYDSIYTERYMHLLSENEDGYKNSAVSSYAKNFRGKMLLAHSSMDENVHIQNTMQLVKAFTDAGKDIDLRIYPPGAHGVSYNAQSFFLLYEVYMSYLDTHLKAEHSVSLN